MYTQRVVEICTINKRIKYNTAYNTMFFLNQLDQNPLIIPDISRL